MRKGPVEPKCGPSLLLVSFTQLTCESSSTERPARARRNSRTASYRYKLPSQSATMCPAKGLPVSRHADHLLCLQGTPSQ